MSRHYLPGSGPFSDPIFYPGPDEQAYHDTPYVPPGTSSLDRPRPTTAPEFTHIATHYSPAHTQWAHLAPAPHTHYRSYPHTTRTHTTRTPPQPTTRTPPPIAIDYPYPDPGPDLRRQLNVDPTATVNLASLPDPPPGQRPTHPLPTLIKLAIYGSPKKMLTLQDIYAALQDRFEWFHQNSDDKAWKNSIRHNLSLNKVFRAVPRPITEPGKGNYWRVDLTDGEGHKRPRKRRLRSQQAQLSTDDEDDEIDSAAASSPTGPTTTDPERQGHHHHHLAGGWERPLPTTAPYPFVSADRDRHPQNHSPSNSDSSSSSYRGSPPSFEAPTAPAPAPAPGPGPTRLDHPTFGQPSFAHSYYGHLRTPPTSFAAHRSAAGGHDAPLGTAVGDPARYHHQMAAAAVAAYDRNAPVVLPPPRPGIEVVRGAGLPSARRIVTPAYAPYYASPFSAPAPDPGHGVYGGDGQHAGGGGVSE